MNTNIETKQSKLSIQTPVGILGIGVEGRATINYLLKHGITNITALDRNSKCTLSANVKKVFGNNYLDKLSQFKTIFKSPGIRPDHPSLEKAREQGIHITSALSYFLEHCPCPVIGVTGTVGKGTACSIIAETLELAGFTTYLGGNIGKSPLAFIDEVTPNNRVILEVSSFQAMDISRSPQISVILKTTSEHLDWHHDTDEYRQAKANMLHHQTQTDTVVFNADSNGAIEIAKKSFGEKLGFSLKKELKNGLFLKNEQFVLQLNNHKQILPIQINNCQLPGKFNLENIAAGILAAVVAGGEINPVCTGAQKFKSLPHRLEFVDRFGDIKFYNDSYATRPDAAIAAISAFNDPLSLILGGSEKNADFDELIKKILSKSNIVSVSLIGATAKRIENSIKNAKKFTFKMATFNNLEDAMEAGTKALDKKGIVLMAPACASFGMFKNYKERGKQFRTKAIEISSR